LLFSLHLPQFLLPGVSAPAAGFDALHAAGTVCAANASPPIPAGSNASLAIDLNVVFAAAIGDRDHDSDAD
jgi:hypothetical protein